MIKSELELEIAKLEFRIATDKKYFLSLRAAYVAMAEERNRLYNELAFKNRGSA